MRHAPAVRADNRRCDLVVRPDFSGSSHAGLRAGFGQRTEIARHAQANASCAGLFQKIPSVNGFVHNEKVIDAKAGLWVAKKFVRIFSLKIAGSNTISRVFRSRRKRLLTLTM
jgi:hypothetical protein